MKHRLSKAQIGFGLALALGTLLVQPLLAQSSSSQSKEDDISFVNVDQFNIKVIGDKTISKVKNKAGKPVTVQSTSQATTITAKYIEFTQKSDSRLESAMGTGGVTLLAKRPSESGQGLQTVEVQSDTVNLAIGAQYNQVDLNGKVHLVNQDPSIGQSVTADAQKGEMQLSPAGQKDALRTAKLSGSVHLVAIRNSGKGKLTAQADRMLIDNTKKPATMILEGNVTIDGNDALFNATASDVGTATLTIGPDGKIQELDLEGVNGKPITIKGHNKG